MADYRDDMIRIQATEIAWLRSQVAALKAERLAMQGSRAEWVERAMTSARAVLPELAFVR